MLFRVPDDLVGVLPALEHFDASFNSMRGALPDALCGLRGLRRLSLAYNNLFGSIPACYGAMNFTALDLSNNYVYGSLPRLVSSLASLDVSYNNLGGTVPAWLGGLPALQVCPVLRDGCVSAVR